MEGRKEILGTWISENESASFYASICSDLKNRGVEDIFIARHDNLTGLSDAINAVFQRQRTSSASFIKSEKAANLCPIRTERQYVQT